MPKQPKYRLQVLLIIKERAKRACERELARALKQLAEEEARLKKMQEEKRRIQERIATERRLLYDKLAGGGALVKDPQVRQNFLRKLAEDLEELERRITEQKETIRQAKIKVERCRRNYILAARELRVMEEHRELWEKKLRKALTAQEDKMMNELGQVVYQMHKGR